MNDIQVVPKCVSVRVSRPSIASVYLVRVSCPCIASVYRVRANIRDFKSVSFTPHPSVFDELETAPSALSGVNVARNVARNVVRGVSRNVARDVGGCDSMNILLERDRRRFFTSVITCP